MIQFLDILSVVVNLLYAFIFFLLLQSFLPTRGGISIRIISLISSAPISLMVIYANDIVNLLVTLFALMAYILIFYRGSPIEKLTVLLIVYPILIATNFLMINFSGLLFFNLTGAPGDADIGWTAYMELMSNVFYLIASICRLVFWLAVYLVFKKHRLNMRQFMNNRTWALIDALMIAPMVAIFTIILFQPDEPVIIYPICIAAILSSLGGIYLTAYISKSMQLSFNMQVLEQEYSHFKERMKEEEKIASIYHDMKNHLLILKAQSDTGNLTKSIIAIEEQIAGYENYHHTQNDFLDVIIKDKAAVAKENNIDFNAQIDFSSGSFIAPLDISTIFGNALDNAIEASVKTDVANRLITVKASDHGGMLVVVFENNTVDLSVSTLTTTKADTSHHGYGIKNIASSVEKYGGEYTIKSENHKFVLKIIIPIEII